MVLYLGPIEVVIYSLFKVLTVFLFDSSFVLGCEGLFFITN